MSTLVHEGVSPEVLKTEDLTFLQSFSSPHGGGRCEIQDHEVRVGKQLFKRPDGSGLLLCYDCIYIASLSNRIINQPEVNPTRKKKKR